MAKSSGLDFNLLFVLILAIIVSEAVIKPVIGWTKVKVLATMAGGTIE